MILKLAGLKQDWLFTKNETFSKIVFKKSFTTENRIRLLSKYSSVLFNFKKQQTNCGFCGSDAMLLNWKEVVETRSTLSLKRGATKQTFTQIFNKQITYQW